MDIRVLKYFLMVAREENITRAAQILHITQPTLSRQLIQLEDELGVKLLYRSNHNVSLTDEGILFRRRAQDIVDIADKAKGELQQTDEIGGEIAIGCGEFQSMEELSELMVLFQQKYPQVKYTLRSGNNQDIKIWLEQGKIDLGLLIEPVEISKYDFIRMKTKEQWGVLVHEQSPFAQYSAIKPGDLVGTPLITVNDEAIHGELANWSGEYAKLMSPVVHYNLLYNGAALLNDGQWAAVCIKLNCHYEKLSFIPFEPAIELSTVLAWRERQPNAKATQRFITFVRNGL